MKNVIKIILFLIIISSSINLVKPNDALQQSETTDSTVDFNSYDKEFLPNDLKLNHLTNPKVPMTEFSTNFGSQFSNIDRSVAIDSVGNIIIVGGSIAKSYPSMISGSKGKGLDILVVKFDENLNLLWSTLIGGSDFDNGIDLAIDKNDDIVVVGISMSADFPTKNAYNATYGGGQDSVLIKISKSGVILFSTYIGGKNSYLASVAIDTLNRIIITGYASNNLSGSVNSGSEDVLIARFSSEGILDAIIQIGDINNELGYSIAISSNNDIVVGGLTQSPLFPVINAYDNIFSSNRAGFILKLSNETLNLIWSTYLEGSHLQTEIRGVSIDLNGNILATGFTNATDFPMLNAYDSTLNGISDAFITKFSSSGNLLWSTFLGSDKDDVGNSITSDSVGDIYVTGPLGFLFGKFITF